MTWSVWQRDRGMLVASSSESLRKAASTASALSENRARRLSPNAIAAGPTVSFEFFPPKTAEGRRQLDQCIAELAVVELPAVGHYPQIEDPAAVLAAFLAFHDGLRPRA